MSFDDFFHKATAGQKGTAGQKPFPFQVRFATGPSLPALVKVPTGLGKTAMAVLGWLWRRRHSEQSVKQLTPRRLVYCLPMRVLVEQTRDEVQGWIENLGLAKQVKVYVLMGGEEKDDWDLHPENAAILVGTQDMLLSRALNRGYGMSRYRWPMHFGLLNTGCLWVFDEIQLMGAGLATTTQLEAFRRLLPSSEAPWAKDGQGCQSVWMSATMQRDWLKTVDFEPFLEDAAALQFDFKEEIEADGLDESARRTLEERWAASKPLARAEAVVADPEKLAGEVLRVHKPGTRTIVIVNTVHRAVVLHGWVSQKWGSEAAEGLVLVHSRFRPGDRQRAVNRARAEPPPQGTIVISTQVIEAGVDVSATTLFTELAPWASLVQRFGRCNRKGKDNERAQVFWIDVPKDQAAPYESSDLDQARGQLQEIGNKPKKDRDVGLKLLPLVPMRLDRTHVIRRRDLVDLFDTTPDLAGNDIDIDRFVRELEDSDIRVFWRKWDQDVEARPPDDKAWRRARREELCPAPVGEFKRFAASTSRKGKVWHWDFLDGRWVRADSKTIYPGQTYLVHVSAGGYNAESGWGVDHGKPFDVVEPVDDRGLDDDEYDDDGLSKTGRRKERDVWQTIAQHTDDVCRQIESIVEALSLTDAEQHVLAVAARWHDWGKAHEKFQIKIDDGQELTGRNEEGQAAFRRERPDEWRGRRDIAKAPGDRKDQDSNVVDLGFWTRVGVKDGGRRHFRHELVSALAVLQRQHTSHRRLTEDDLNLVAYLIAAHHGKVRLSIRSLPKELWPRRPDGKRLDDCRFARGVWDGDLVPETDLGGRVKTPAVTLSLEPMELGLCERDPFVDQPSWAERVIRLRDTMGPFWLAYMEALLRAGDMRASAGDDR